jgi:hypothetical protein
MYVARFSYDLLPANRQQALGFIQREVEAARRDGLAARLLIPLTRGEGDAALQFEVELTSGEVESPARTGHWMHAFSEILTAPPCVEILRVDEPRQA